MVTSFINAIPIKSIVVFLFWILPKFSNTIPSQIKESLVLTWDTPTKQPAHQTWGSIKQPNSEPADA